MTGGATIDEQSAMRRALELAARGQGHVEPNPMVGSVVVRDGQIVGEGWHERFGGPHAEVNALRAAGDAAQRATLYVTLEPCCHTGKTPPCTEAILAAGISRVVVATTDPFPAVDGGGIRQLQAAGVECLVGVEKEAANELLAPFKKLVTTGQPWVVAKWAMTLDGKIATKVGDSRWISGEASRARVHELRGRVDAVIVGAGTLVADDPLLTARPPGPRTPLRVVIAGERPLPLERTLWSSRGDGPVLVAISEGYPVQEADRLRDLGVEVITADVPCLLNKLGQRKFTNVLVEGGGKLLGRLFDQQLIDEVWAFIAPKIIGGDGPTPIGGGGVTAMNDAHFFGSNHQIESLGDDYLIRSRIRGSKEI